MKFKLTLLLLVVTWTGIAIFAFWLRRHGGIYDLTRPIGSVEGRTLVLGDMFASFALHRNQLMAEAVLRNRVCDLAGRNHLTPDPSSQRSLAETLGRALEAELPEGDRKRVAASARSGPEVYGLLAIVSRTQDIDDVLFLLGRSSFEEVAARHSNDSLGAASKGSLGELSAQEIERRFGTASFKAVRALKNGEFTSPQRVGNNLYVFCLRSKRRLPLGTVPQFLVRTQGWNRILVWLKAESVQVPTFNLQESDYKSVFEEWLRALPS